eukprot:TRINITY_DN7669_c0_g1_i2.p1 TRINITY_DN7669_c0_g1~~TRINITY_DN7669_c0_g1_i2.p1  ORF type:complete len:1355 (-),score=201.34 TRINITY_DN7669_c0_g1_i2:879-4943(-)
MIFLVGGKISLESMSTSIWAPMEDIFIWSGQRWLRKRAGGDVPAGKYKPCFLGLSDSALLIGGESEKLDNYLYEYRIDKSEWIRKGNTPPLGKDIFCASLNHRVYIFHKNMESKTSLLRYNIQDGLLGSWEFVPLERFSIKMLIAISVWKGSLLLVLEPIETDSTVTIVVATIGDTISWEKEIVVKPSPCVVCGLINQFCFLKRSEVAYGILGNKLHLIGGMYGNEAIHDVVIIDLEDGTIANRINYELMNTDSRLQIPPPRTVSSFVAFEKHIFIFGGINAAKKLTNDGWTWSLEHETWLDTTISYYPIHRFEASISSDQGENIFLFGGATSFVEELLLNDLWRFSIVHRIWTLLFQGSSTDGPSPRSEAAMYLEGPLIYIYGGRTQTGDSDSKVWSFNQTSQVWTSINLSLDILSNERPLLRIGARSIAKGSYHWIWGGQAPTGLQMIEQYSASFILDFKNKSLNAIRPSGLYPLKRKFHALCQVDENSTLLYGGVDFFGSSLEDMWKFTAGAEGGRWTILDTPATKSISGLIWPTCLPFLGAIAFTGYNQAKGSMQIWIYEQGSKSMQIVPVPWESTSLKTMNSYSVVSHQDRLIFFAGKGSATMSNGIFQVKPEYCTGALNVISTTLSTQTFDDGSGHNKYLLDTNCTWILKQANYIHLEYEIRQEDSLFVYSLTSNGAIGSLLLRSSSVSHSTTIQSVNGFLVEFKANHANERGRVFCENCKGFNITHIRCPEKSSFDYLSTQCICEPGTEFNSGLCQETSTEASKPNELIIAVSVGISCLVLVSMGFWYYKIKLSKRIYVEKMQMAGVIDFNELVFLEPLGTGSYGEVYKGLWRGGEVAIKKLLQLHRNSAVVDSFKEEISLMIQLRHPNVILYMGACFEANNICLVCELMEQGSLYDVLHDTSREIDYNTSIGFALDIAYGMQYLHSANPPMIHRDLKSPNILMDDRSRLKISDFGMTRSQHNGVADDIATSILWASPELLSGGRCTIHSDVYSYGIVLWEIFHRKEPFKEVEHLYQVSFMVSGGLRPSIDTKIPIKISELMQASWHQEPNSRPNFSAIIRMLKEANLGSSKAPRNHSKYNFEQKEDSIVIYVSLGRAVRDTQDAHLRSELFKFMIEAYNKALAIHNFELVRDFKSGTFIAQTPTIEQAIRLSNYLLDELFGGNKIDADEGKKPINIRKDKQVGMVIMTFEEQCGIKEHEELWALMNHGSENEAIVSKRVCEEIQSGLQLTLSDISRQLLVKKTAQLFYGKLRKCDKETAMSLDFDTGPIGESTIQQEGTLSVTYGAELWELDYEQLDVLPKPIGSGSYGSVFKGNHKGVDVAVKKLLKQRGGSNLVTFYLEYMQIR